MTRDTNIVKESLSALVGRLSKDENSSEDLKDLLLRLNSQFPGDVGCFCIYFMNHIILKPGQAMFLAPNLPHAYLDGGKRYQLNIKLYTCTAGLVWLVFVMQQNYGVFSDENLYDGFNMGIVMGIYNHL